MADEIETEGNVTDKRLEEFADFENKLRDLLTEYGYGVGLYYLMKPIDPNWDENVGTMDWGMVHGIFNSDYVSEAIDAHTKGLKEDADEPTKHMTKQQLNIMYEANMAMSSMFNRSIQEAYTILPNVMTFIEQLKSALGLDKARMIPLKCGSRYFVYTESGVKYLLKYEKDFKYYLKRMSGGTEDPPDEALHFIGMVQKSGNIFHKTMDYPIVSTGDKMVFAKRSAMRDVAFITGEILDVQRVENLN